MRYEKWSLGYWALKQYARFAHWLILKKTYVIGKEKIPGNKPIIFAPNHQNALSDPMAVLLNTRFQPVWLGRADIFGKSKIVDTILRFIKIIPVYRIRDGKENLDKNRKTFSMSIKVLENKSALALFPEAAHSFKRQMLPHQKAVPRIAFMAEEQTDSHLDIQIIPAGIYYSHYWKFNRTLIVNFGEPIPVKAFLESYQQNQNAATIALKKEVYNAMLPLTVNINSKEYYNEFERIREMYGRHFMLQQNKKWSTIELFKSDQLLTKKLDELEAESPEKIASLAAQADRFYNKLSAYGLKSWLLYSGERQMLTVIFNLLLLLAGLPLFIYGFLFNFIPFFLIDRIVRKKVKDSSFWSTFFLVPGLVLFPLFYLIEFLAVAGLIPGVLLKIAFIVSLPFAGKLAFKWYILLRKTIGRSRLLKLKWFKSKTYSQLLQEKNQLFAKLDALLLKR